MTEHGTSGTYHRPVLLDETIEALAVRPDGVYVDGTAGGGGHSYAIASRLTSGGRLISFDQDPDAVVEASRRLQGLPARVIRANFTEIARVLREEGLSAPDGILLDIGVSSHQLDTPERGFSYHADAPLDMRMSQEGTTAADLVNTWGEKELSDIFYRYGEEKFSRPIARAIGPGAGGRTGCDHRTSGGYYPRCGAGARRRDGHPARRVFQACALR